MVHSYEKPTLPYETDALEPHISAKTLTVHYGGHHLAYWNRLNQLMGEDEQKSLGTPSVEELIRSVATVPSVLFNQAAQVYNHSLYWKSMGKGCGGAPTGDVLAEIVKSYGSFDNFKAEFNKVAGGHFGSGWAWTVWKDGKMAIVGTHDADCPLRGDRGAPLMVCDVWEHAYYLDYQNLRPKYLESWWNVVNWTFVAAQLEAAKKN